MNILIILIPVSLILASLGLAGFLWTLRARQYEDLDGDAWRILVEDDQAKDDI
ncbi:cbb3-type cytochrome oxidase assembly protein CcoS [Yoonia sp. MH D7]